MAQVTDSFAQDLRRPPAYCDWVEKKWTVRGPLGSREGGRRRRRGKLDKMCS